MFESSGVPLPGEAALTTAAAPASQDRLQIALVIAGHVARWREPHAVGVLLPWNAAGGISWTAAIALIAYPA
jgi:hypothetical protein